MAQHDKVRTGVPFIDATVKRLLDGNGESAIEIAKEEDVPSAFPPYDGVKMDPMWQDDVD